MNASETKDTSATERQRKQVRFLCQSGHYEDAADLCAALSDAVLIFTPCEAIADYICKKRPAEAARLYRIAADASVFEGTQATGSGEGIAATDVLRRVEDKLKMLSAKDEPSRPNIAERMSDWIDNLFSKS